MSSKSYGKKFDRLYTAVVTPYKENYEVDEQALRKLLRYFLQPKFVAAGGGIIINPEAGEIFYLTREQKRRNVEIAMEEVQGKVPLFAGVIDLTTRDTVKVALDAKQVGVDGLFIIPPIGAMDVTISWDPVKYPEVWLDMAKDIDRAADLPIVVHPVVRASVPYGIGLPVEPTMLMCKEIPNIVGWKMTYTWEGYLIVGTALRTLDRHVGVFFMGNLPGALAIDLWDGTVWGAWNYAMEPILDYIDTFKKGDIPGSQKIWNGGLGDLLNYVRTEWCRLHIRYKLAAWLRGLIPSPILQPPMPKPKREEADIIRALLSRTGIEVIDKKEIDRFFATLS